MEQTYYPSGSKQKNIECKSPRKKMDSDTKRIIIGITIVVVVWLAFILILIN